MIVTSEYVYNSPEINEIKDIIEKTRVDFACKYGYNCEEVKINFNVKFFDKTNNKTKNTTIKCIEKIDYSISNKI